MNKMNQTRSPRKRLLSLILAVILMIGLLPISAFATSASAQAGEDKAATQDSEFLRIFHLDCGRKYFTVSEIEGIIDQLAENHFTHLQLAFGNDGLRFLLDDMSVTVNGTEYDSKKVKSAVQSGNSTYSSSNGTASTMLTEEDMDAIIKYANDKGIQVIPMFNSPYHMDALLNAMENLGITDARKELNNVNRYLNLESANAVAFVKALQQKYMNYFKSKDCKYYNIATDEYAFDHITNAVYTEFAKYVNDLAKMVKDSGMTPLAYNDGFYWKTRTSSVDFDPDIVICYWSNGGNRASAEDLIGKHYKILNNNDSWYYVLGDALSAWANPQWRYKDAAAAIPTVPVTQIKGYSGSTLPVGSVLCCWCDYPSKSYPYTSNDNKTGVNDVYALIALMAKHNPDYFTGKVKLSASDDATGVSVAVTGTEGQKATVEVKKITSDFTFDTEAHVSYNVTPTVDGKAYTGEGTVTLPVPEGWATEDSRICAYIIDNDAVKLISGTLSGGKYTFQVPHFSEMGLVQLAKGAGSTENVTVTVGRTSKAYDLTGDNLPNDGTYPLGDVASYTVTTAASGWKVESKAATTIVTGTQYVIGNGSQYLKRSGSSIRSTTNLDDATKWTISSSGTGYTIESDSYYLRHSSDRLSVSTSSSGSTWSWSANDGFSYSVSGWFGSTTTYYLTYSTYSDGWTLSDYASTKGQPYTVTEVPGGKTVTFKGLNPGSTSVTLGDTTYSVTVVEKQNVEIPISIIDYRADGLLFDFQVGGETYDYGLVHNYDTESSNSFSQVTGNGGTLPGESYGTKIAGTTLENTGYDASDYYSGQYYLWGNKWSRSGMVESELGSNGMPVYTNATVARVAQELAAGNYNSGEMAGVANDNDVIYTTFIKSGKVTNTVTTKMSDAFSARKTWDNITNAYDLAWYLLNTLYQADTNMTTVTGTDGAGHAVPIYGMKVDAYDRLILTEDNGVYSFDAANKKSNYDTESHSIYEDDTASSLQFYPIDGLGYDAILGDTTDKTNTSGNGDRPEHPNGSYTLRGEAQFVYQEDLYFEFSGDDDVYMYINGTLALDLGGAHGICTKRVNLKDVATKCHLTPGEVATFTFFYMERNSDASNFKIETNMELVQRAINVEKKAYDTSYANEYASGTAVINGTTVAYDLIVTNKSNSPMSQIKLTDTDSLGGNVTIGSGVDVSPDVTPGASNDKGTVALGQGNGYALFITDSTGTEVANTRKSFSSLQDLSNEIASLTLPAGQSLHVRFLTATTKINASKILDYINTVEVRATVGGKALSDTASHELYSYNANDTGRTYVVDFGLPLKIEGIFDTGAQSNIGEVSLSPKNEQKYGTVTIAPNGFNTTLTYTRTANTTINEPETITLDVVYNIGNSNIKLEKTLTIIPASNVYYEDSLATFTNGSGAALGANWKLVDNKGNETTEGTAPTQVLQQLGDKAIYGYDVAYNSSSMLSMGTAHKVTVTANMANTDAWTAQPTSAWPTAQFTFKGTGFDIISLTNNKSGTIFVDVTNTATGKQYNYVVNNYYGYTYQNGEWVVDKNASDTLYQIPVMKVDGLGYGEYNVVIKVAYNKFFDTAEAKEYSFWLDAVRIYDPMGEYADYTQDNEGYPQYIKLRDTLVDGTAKPDGTDKTVFIDGGSTADIKTTYANYGPNNEVYLMKGQAITFKIPANDKIASIQIGAKAPKGTANLNVNETEIVSGGLSTATEMYYQIANAGGQFTITNTGDGILSLTNLKITYSAKDSVSLGTLNTQEQENAVNLVRALFAAPVATFSPETFQADWGRAVRAGKRATLTVKTSADVESITVDGQSITSYTTRTQRTGWGWWSPKVTYHVFTYTITAPAQTTDYAVCAVNAEGTASEAVTATLTVKPTTWWNWWF